MDFADCSTHRHHLRAPLISNELSGGNPNLFTQFPREDIALVAQGRSGGGIGRNDGEKFIDQSDALVNVIGRGHVVNNREARILSSIRIAGILG